MKKSSEVIHPPEIPVALDNRPLVAPIYQSVKFEFPDVDETQRALRGDRSGFFYSRSSNPTTRQLEKTVAQLQGRDEALVVGSGVAAIAQTLIALTQTGDHVLCFVETYGPTRALIRRTLQRFGVRHTMLSIEDDAGIERVLSTTPTKLVIFESPTNPVTKIANIPLITRAAKAHGALTVLDNTLAGLHQHGDTDVDVFVHSLTKYASGHGDVLGGAIIASSALIKRIRPDSVLLGAALDPHAAWLIQRGLKTYFLRYDAAAASAQRIAEFLAQQDSVSRVHYPGLPQHPRHELAKQQMQSFGSIVSFDMQAGAAAGDRFADALKLFSITPSMGSTESLVIPPALMGPRDLPAELEQRSGIAVGTVRLSIGLEDTDDLLADVASALAAAGTMAG